MTNVTTRRWVLVGAALAAGCAGGPEPAGGRVIDGAPEAAGDEAAGDEGAVASEAAPALPGWGLLDKRDEVHLRGEDFFPEGVTASKNGTLYVGSYSTGAIDRVLPGSDRAQPFIPAPAGLSAVGLLADDATGSLWACMNDAAGAAPGFIKRYDLKTGRETGSFALPQGSTVVNDMALDAAGNLYATETVQHVIFRLRPGASALEVWAESDAFGGADFTLNGIAFDGASNLYTVKYLTHELYRVPIGPGGAAGEPVRIEVVPPIEFPDGIKAIDATTFAVAENDVGKVSIVKVSGDRAEKTVLANGLAEPTTLAIVGPNVWVAEGQLSFFFGAPGAPTLPFKLRRFFLP
ncbi:MAG TPA: hypothetical protein VFS43_17890 [Polyangiaceae bacterium]|nr:hypothetical protein [Polyangiaceae bacterium]